jgi:phospholipid/cholesterol/gamma-HCH transport system permease protein
MVTGVTDFELRVTGEGGLERLSLSGRVGRKGAERLQRELERAVEAKGGRLALDLSEVESIDGSAAAIIAELWDRQRCAGGELALVGASGSVASVLELYTSRGLRECLRPQVRRPSVPEQVGRATVALLGTLREASEFVGNFTRSGWATLRRPASLSWSSIPRQMERAGADGLPIVLLIGFLIGLITAFQAAVQLGKLGADSFVANLVALSLTRELAPLMTAIVIAGRSGASIAAELGTMKVSEEIDALRVLGIDPYRFLVFPRVIALTLMLPVLTLLSDAIGIAGGVVIAFTQLDLGLLGYMNATRESLELGDVFGGIAKSVVFGFLIAMIGCERGMATRGGAEGVGRSTTAAVVNILFHLILVDALFTVLYKMLGI